MSGAFDRVILAAALAYLDGSSGVPKLRELIRARGPGTADLVCASVLALTNRVGTPATPDAVWLLENGTPVGRDYASLCLFFAGDHRAWIPAVARLKLKLSTARLPDPGWEPGEDITEVTWLIAFLLREADGPAELGELRELVAKRWDRVLAHERNWLGQQWSAMTSVEMRDGPTPAPSYPKNLTAEALLPKGQLGLFDSDLEFMLADVPGILKWATRARERRSR